MDRHGATAPARSRSFNSLINTKSASAGRLSRSFGSNEETKNLECPGPSCHPKGVEKSRNGDEGGSVSARGRGWTDDEARRVYTTGPKEKNIRVRKNESIRADGEGPSTTDKRDS